MSLNPASARLALLTDLYQLTMACGYWKTGRSEQRAVFHLTFRSNPFRGGYAVAAGLGSAIEYLRELRFTDDDVSYLGKIPGNDGRPVLPDDFLEHLRQRVFSLDVDAVPEGTFLFPHEPLIRVAGPILECQIVESALLNLINFQSLIATKAARMVTAAGGDSVLEFGLRRAQGIDGSLSASRAAYIGGCDATSNVLAGKLYGIPVRGTHAHSWVMSFESEREAFRAYADALPNNCVFLVDTYDTVEGVRHAIEAGRQLANRGHRMIGIRLDSGDLAALSIKARAMLDEAGFEDAQIVASNDLDERLVQSLKQQGAQISVWGVGTRLVTGGDQAALGGVYKLGAIQDDQGQWHPKVKLSEQIIKTSTPGILQVRRFFDQDHVPVGDMIYSELSPPHAVAVAVDQFDATRRTTFSGELRHVDLLQPVMRNGQVICDSEDLMSSRSRTLSQLHNFPKTVLRFDHPQQYPVGLEEKLAALKTHLVTQARDVSRGPGS